MKLLIVLGSGEELLIYLFDNLTLDKFNYYIQANQKCIGVDDDEVVEELNEKLSQAAIITNPIDERMKSIDGIILLQMAL